MRIRALATAVVLVTCFGVEAATAYPLTVEQRKRLDRYLPRTFPKLEARDPVHVVALGDSVMGGYTPLETAWQSNNPLFSYTGVFLTQLAREFFYPGGVRLVNPPPQGISKLTELLGDELTLENLTGIDATALTGLRRISTDAFLHDPDLLLVQYGIYDAFERLPIDTYRRALQETIDAARKRNVDLILFAPTLVNLGQGEMKWGVTRAYASAAREVASNNGVLFIDAGQYLSRFGGGVLPDTEPAAVREVLSDRLQRMFNYGPELREVERVHPALRANDYLGEAMFEDLKNGPRSSKFTYAAVADFDSQGLVKTVVAIRNQTDENQRGTMTALSVSSALNPVDPTQRFEVPAGATTQLVFAYERPIVGKARDGSDILFPLEPTDEFARFGFFVEDTVGSEVVDLPTRIGPITAVWKSRQFVNVTDQIRLEWDLVNGSDKAISGTFQVGMGDRIGQPTAFSVSPLGTKTVFSLFEFAPTEDAAQFQRDVWIQTEVNGLVTRFHREMEASRDRVLGEELPMQAWGDYVNAPPAGSVGSNRGVREGVIVRFDADEDALYISTALEGIRLPDLGDNAALEALIFLDARSM
ncbi:MAG: SGNH/GDSL hydrolase family protein, partial [Verrucomicrobiota bacterium]